jgi:hypothetical protein
MTSFKATAGPAIERDDVVEKLARTSHDTWMRQAQRDQKATYPEITDHDRERAEDIVTTLELLGLLHGVG